MNERELEQLVETLYPLFLNRLKRDGFFKNCLKMSNATVDYTSGDTVYIKLPFESKNFAALNQTGEALSPGDSVCFMYWIDLKNAVVMFKMKK